MFTTWNFHYLYLDIALFVTYKFKFFAPKWNKMNVNKIKADVSESENENVIVSKRSIIYTLCFYI